MSLLEAGSDWNTPSAATKSAVATTPAGMPTIGTLAEVTASITAIMMRDTRAAVANRRVGIPVPTVTRQTEGLTRRPGSTTDRSLKTRDITAEVTTNMITSPGRGAPAEQRIIWWVLQRVVA